MKKIWLLALALSLILSACALPTLPTGNTPAPQVDLPATAQVFVQQTLLAQPTPTTIPSNTPVVTTPSSTETLPTATQTQDAAMLTLTATFATGALTSETSTVTVTGAPASSTPTGTRNPSIGATPTQTLHPRFFGTVPPRPPSGTITLINKSKAEAYISLQCTANDGEVTILEYPVRRQFAVKAPAGNYIFVAWVGGRKMTGSFHLGNNGELTIQLFKDSVAVSNR